MTNAQSKNINEEINLDTGICGHCDGIFPIKELYDPEDECLYCWGCVETQEGGECEKCVKPINLREFIEGNGVCRNCVNKAEEDEAEDKETQICEECGEECPHPAVIKYTDGPSHSVFFCRPCLNVKKDCPECEKSTTNDELILCDGVCRKCDQKGK
jgi:hypothetical protein